MLLCSQLPLGEPQVVFSTNPEVLVLEERALCGGCLMQKVAGCSVQVKRRSRGRNSCFSLGQEEKK